MDFEPLRRAGALMRAAPDRSRPAVAFREIEKRFPGVVALRGVSFDVSAGSCHALMGENGAGKSTLGKILAGIHCPDGGHIEINGAPRRLRSPIEARLAGVGIVHQSWPCPNLSVAENLCLFSLPRRGLAVDGDEMMARASRFLREVGADCDPREELGVLPTAQTQLVQIAAALATGARILVMDEPTSSLSLSEARRLEGLISQLRERGATILYVSHRMDEIFRVCDTVTVLRNGGHIATMPLSQTNHDDLVRMMIGRPLARYFPAHATRERWAGAPPRGGSLVSGKVPQRKLPNPGGRGVGNGRIGRLRAQRSGAGHLRPQSVGHGPGVRRGAPRSHPAPAPGYVAGHRSGGRGQEAAGLRARDGLRGECDPRLAALSGRARLFWPPGSLPVLPARKAECLRLWDFIRLPIEREWVARFFSRLRVRAPSPEAPALTLSGGNQQKVILARCLARKCRILILDEPTRGVDVGAKAEIHRLIDDLASAGHAILMISSELPEVLNLSTRVITMRAGRVAGALPRAEATQETVMQLMAGRSGIRRPAHPGESAAV